MDGNSINSTPNRLRTINGISKAFNNMLDSISENIEVIEVTNEKNATKETTSLLSKFETSKDWADQLSAIQRGMSLVQGGICDYSVFTNQLIKIATYLIPCVSNIRSTLVKYSCLYIAQLAKKLKDKFEFSAEALIPTLFQCTTNATKIISNSCKQTILVIVRNCQSRMILSSLTSEIDSKSQVHRNIVCESLQIIINDWKQLIVQNCFKKIEKCLNLFVNDAGFEAREITRNNIQIYIVKFPERKSILLNQLDSKNKQKFIDNTVTNKTKSPEQFPVPIRPLEPYWEKESYIEETQNNIKQNNEEKTNNFKYMIKSPIKNNDNYKRNKAKSPTQFHNITTKQNKNKKLNFDQRAETTLDLSNLYKTKIDALLNNSSKTSQKTSENKLIYSPDKETSKQSMNNSSSSLIYDSVNKSPYEKIQFNKNKTTTISKLRKPTKIGFYENEDINNVPNYEIEQTKPVSILKNKKETKVQETKNENEDINNVPNYEIEQTKPVSILKNKKETKVQETKNENELQFVYKEYNENIFIDSIRKARTESNNFIIEKNANDIADGFIHCFKSTNENILISSFNLILEVLPIISYAFSYYLDDLITVLLDKANQTKSRISLNASAVLRAISTEYSGEILLFIGLKCPPTPPLLSFAANIVRKNESVLSQNEISKELLTVCCAVYESTNEQKFSALSVGLLNKIKEINPNVFQAFANSVDDDWRNLLRSLHLYVSNESISDGNKLPIRVFPQLQKIENSEQKLESILHLIDENKNKYEPILTLQQFFEETKGKYFIPAIPYLVGLIRSSYYTEIENCVLTLTKTGYSTSLMNETINYFITDPSTSSVNLLSLIIKGSKSKDLTPRIQEIIDKLLPLLSSKSAEVRKAAVFCFVEMRSIIGKSFDTEIEKLPSISRKMIFFFYNKNKIQNDC